MLRSDSFLAFKAARDAEAAAREAISQSIELVRLAMEGLEGRYPLAPGVTIHPVTAGGVPAEWVDAPGARDDMAILYIHGGCFISGAPATVRECCARLSAAAGARVLSVDYRLAPEHPFPAALDDVVAAYDWLLSEGYAPARLMIAGESAGGGLTISALMRLRQAGLPLPAAAAPISPWIDMALDHESLTRNVGRDIASTLPLHLGAKAYVGGGDPRSPLISPLYGDLSGLPPLLIQVGGGEVLLDDGLAIAHKARRQGVDVTLEVWPDMTHVWHWFASELDEGAQAIEAIGAFARARLG